MELADADHLERLDDRTIGRLRGALASLDAAFLAKLARVGERLDDPMRAPMRTWNARRLPGGAAILARLFVLHDPVTIAEATVALGAFEPLVHAGILDRAGDKVASRAHLALAGGLVVFGDGTAAGEGVPPLNGVTPLLARAAMPAQRVGAALDLGCGAGAIALALAAAADRVVATDVNPRALAWTRFNARLNGVERIEVRLGDRYAPVRGERFDRLVSQPPFLARRAGAASSAFAHGGARGDELALQVLAGAAAHLTDRGRALVLADWPLLDGDAIDARVQAAIDGGTGPAGALVLASPPKNLDEYCTFLAAAEHPRLDEAFAQAALAQRDHLEALGLRGVAQALVVVDLGALARQGALVAVRHAQDAPIAAADVDRAVSAHALAGDEPALLGSRLRLPANLRLVEQPAVHGAGAAVLVQMPAARPEWSFAIAPAAAEVLRAVHRAATVGDAITALAASVPRDGVLAATRHALRSGALDPEAG
jgi:SAM-dependent methyltransferase